MLTYSKASDGQLLVTDNTPKTISCTREHAQETLQDAIMQLAGLRQGVILSEIAVIDAQLIVDKCTELNVL